jgi:hypothetical protein
MQLQGGDSVRQKPTARRRQKPSRREIPGVSEIKNPLRPLENHCLRLLMFKPDLFLALESELKNSKFEPLSVDDFQSAEAQEAFLLLMEAINQQEASVNDFLIDHQPETLTEFLRQINAGVNLEGTPDERIYDDLFDTITRLRLVHIREAIDSIRFLVTELAGWEKNQIDERESLLEYNKKMTELTGERLRLEKALQPEINFQ